MSPEQGSPEELSSALSRLIAVARSEFGETQWRYEKKLISWIRFRRRPGSHSTPIGDGEPVTKEEYDANIAESKRRDLEAFMGRYPQSYTRYDKKISTPGWRERLIEMIKSAETSDV